MESQKERARWSEREHGCEKVIGGREGEESSV
jgi:hypothetical protein